MSNNVAFYLDEGLQGVGAFYLSTSNLFPYNIDNSPDNYFTQYNFTEFVNSDFQCKFAFFFVPVNPSTFDWIERLKSLYQHVKHVFVYISELHVDTVQAIRNVDMEKVSIFANGYFYNSFRYAGIYPAMDWFSRTVQAFNQSGVEKNNLLIHDKFDRSKYFDILLGNRRIHRDFVNYYCHQNHLKENNILTYYQSMDNDLRYVDRTKFILGNSQLEFDSPIHHSVGYVNFNGWRTHLSTAIPYEIYNDSYYSLVTETNADNTFNFYTEKIVKPILSRRLFIVIAGMLYLRHLKELGFRTFDNIIDESYDEEEDYIKRWSMALDQLKYLCTLDPVAIHQKIHPTLEHNYRLMIETDWHKPVCDRIRDVYHEYI